MTKHPERVPQLTFHLRTILRASRNFEWAAWTSYDAAYQLQVADCCLLDCTEIDPHKAFSRLSQVHSEVSLLPGRDR